MNARKGIVTWALCAAAASAVAGCGGGSSGTGTGTGLSLQGTVETAAREPVSGVTVTVVETGDQTVTNAQGNFSLEVSAPDDGLQVQVAAPTIEGVIDASRVDSSDSADATVDLNIVVDPNSKTVMADKLEVHAGIVGLCDAYFNNDRLITQSRPTPKDVQCVAKVSVHRNGRARANVPIAVQYHACLDDTWVTLAQTKTLGGLHAGVGQIGFPFSDDSDHCVYRIVVPFTSNESVQFVEYEIDTLTKQALDIANNH